MTNRIGPVDHTSIGKISNKADETGTISKISRDSGASGDMAQGRISASDTVELTSSAKLLERLEKTLAALPEVDRSRVDAVKSSIANGDYEIDADAIANAMLTLERSLSE